MSQTEQPITTWVNQGKAVADRIGHRRILRAAVIFAILLPFLRLLFLLLALSYHVSSLQQLADNPSPTSIISAGPAIQATRADIVALRNEAGFVLKLGPSLSWVPVIGPDLVYSNQLLEMATQMLIAAADTYSGLEPLMKTAAGEASPQPNEVLIHLADARPRFESAQAAITAANEVRSQIPVDRLSPLGQRLINKTDRVLLLMRQGIAAINIAPALLGADGQKSYLLIIQNQDELRPTGGFVSAAGIVTINQGDVLSVNIQDSYAVGNSYLPDPPTPIARYMDAPVLVFRDANWWPDFPTSAIRLIQLYRADHPEQKLDGVIAIDQAAVATLLKATGPITVQDVPEPISSDNLIAYMRSSWSTEPGEGVSLEWWLHRKDFIQNMASSLIHQLRAAPWAALGQAGTEALREKHILIWLQDPQASPILAEQGWSGAIQPGAGDYLYVVEANIGFNKVNSIVQKRLEYTVDLSTLSAPTATVSVVDFNPAKGELPCKQDPDYGLGTYEELINRCYWNYVRVYAPQGAQIIDVTLQDVPGEWMFSGSPVTGALDTAETENGATAFGTLMVVPFETEKTTRFNYQLPQTVVQKVSGQYQYDLLLQKQPGVQDVLLNVKITLPPGAMIVSADTGGSYENGMWITQFLLTEDTHLQLKFALGN